MKFLELNVHGFGQFGSQKTIKFQDGVNVILGPNESGKSTLHNAILASLYQPSKADFNLYASWNNPEVCKTRLTFQISDGRIFRITRDLKSKKVSVEKQEADEFIEVSKTEREAKKIISEHVGFPEKRVFENTICVTQGEMTALKDKVAIKQIKDIISNLITGTEDTSANKAIETLDEKIKAIEGGPRSNGLLDSLRNEIQELNSSLEDVKNQEKLIQTLTEKSKAIEEGITAKESRYIKYEKIKTKYDAIKKLKDDYDTRKEVLKDLINQIEKINGISKDINALDDELKKFIGYEKVSNEIISNIRFLENQKNVMQGDLDKTNIKLKNEQDTFNIAKPEKSNNLLYIGIIIFLIGVFGTTLINSLFIVCILIGIILVILHLIKSKNDTAVAIKTRIEQFESTIREKESSIKDTSMQIESHYSSLPTKNIRELSENYEIYRKKEQNKANLISQKGILLGKNQVEELEKKRDDLLFDIGKIDARLEELGELNLSAEEQIKLQELPVLKNEIDDSKQQIQNILGQLSARSFVKSSIELEEEIEYKKDLITRSQERNSALKIARDVLQQVSTEIQKEMAPELEDKANKILNKITNNKYSEIFIDSNFNIGVMSSEKNDLISPDFLSSGAKDQLYFALRVATSDALSKSVNPPLILDEPFGSFDSQRRESTISLLRKLSENCQIILMTHDSYYQDKADNIISLC
ncbi:MAG: AAA family ATPase [Candidatus Methanoperedens sp.]|nr:AAA family ATPase [Candidatus Methanoperedens sp.]MCZ7405892.1 AAA family ATPase [Candidatus Methanoperedens sp.]